MSEESKKKIFISLIVIIIAVAVFLVIFIFAKASSTQTTNTINTTENKIEIKEMQLKSNTAGAFAMPVSYVGKNDKGITITGTIERGTIKIDDEIQIVGMGKEVIDAKVVRIEKNLNNNNNSSKTNTTNNTSTNTTSNQTGNNTTTNTSSAEANNSVKQATKGDEIIITIVSKDGEEIAKENIARGQVVCEPYTYNQYNTFTASIKLEKNNALKITDISKLDGEEYQIYIRVVDINGTVTVKKADALDAGTISVKMESYVAIEQGTEISIRKDSKTVASGTITGVSNTKKEDIK